MIPTIDIQVHDILIRAFFFPPIFGSKEKLDQEIGDMRQYYSKYGEQILKSIELLSGYSWSLTRIPVLLVPDNPMLKYSFTKFDIEPGVPGVVLKTGRGIRDQWILIHELVHVNQKQSEFWKQFAFSPDKERREDLLEVEADLIALYLIRDLHGPNSEFERDFFDFLENTNEKNKRKHRVLLSVLTKWDLKQKPFRYYLESEGVPNF